MCAYVMCVCGYWTIFLTDAGMLHAVSAGVMANDRMYCYHCNCSFDHLNLYGGHCEVVGGGICAVMPGIRMELLLAVR